MLSVNHKKFLLTALFLLTTGATSARRTIRFEDDELSYSTNEPNHESQTTQLLGYDSGKWNWPLHSIHPFGDVGFRRGRRTTPFEFMISPISEQLITLGPFANKAVSQAISASPRSQQQEMCRRSKINVELERDLRDPVSGQLVRTCRALVALNRCDGQCVSSVRPSFNSPSGVIKVGNFISDSTQIPLTFEVTLNFLDLTRICRDPFYSRSPRIVNVVARCQWKGALFVSLNVTRPWELWNQTPTWRQVSMSPASANVARVP